MAEGTVYESTIDLVPQDMRVLQRLTASGGHNPRVFTHRAVWSLLADDKDAQRDFVFSVRSLAPFSAIVRTRQPIESRTNDWKVRSYPLETHFEQGRILGFRLEAVAEIARSVPGTRQSKRMDIVLDAIARQRGIQEGSADDLDLAFADPGEIAAKAALDWISSQGKRRGFEIFRNEAGEDAFVLVDHQRHKMPHKSGSIQAGSITLEGMLQITDPVAFSEALVNGFGRLKAYGFGLMQVRPV